MVEGFLFIVFITMYVIVTGVISDLFAEKNVTPSVTALILCFCPVIHLYTFIKYVIVKGELGTLKEIDKKLRKDGFKQVEKELSKDE